MSNTWFINLLDSLITNDRVTQITLDIYNIGSGIVVLRESYPVNNNAEREEALLQIGLQCQILRFLPANAPKYAASVKFSERNSVVAYDQAVWINPPRVPEA